MAGCEFFLEIQAPDGLKDVQKYLDGCSMNLKPYVSGYNGKVVLRPQPKEDRFEWDMDPSDTDVLVASGEVFLPVDKAWELLKSLSDMLAQAGFPHEVLLDDEGGKLAHSATHRWKGI